MRYLFTLLTLAFFGLTAFTVLPSEAPAPQTEIATSLTPGSYAVDHAHSFVGFRIKHLGIVDVVGSFDEYESVVMVDPSDLSTLQATMTAQVGSINTRIEARDNHLRSDDFFDVETYPTLSFTSTGVTVHDGNRFELTGDLTIRDVTRSVTLEGEMLGTAVGMQGEDRIGFSASTTIDRHDFGITWNAAGGAGDPVIGRDVTIMLEIQAIRQDD